MLKWYGRPGPVQHTTHEHKTEDTHWKLLFGDHEPRRQHTHTHAHTKHMLVIMKCTGSLAFCKTHMTLFFYNATTQTDTHTHTILKIIKCTLKPVQTHMHTHTHTLLSCDTSDDLYMHTTSKYGTMITYLDKYTVGICILGHSIQY
jgi:hypothetical protein